MMLMSSLAPSEVLAPVLRSSPVIFIRDGSSLTSLQGCWTAFLCNGFRQRIIRNRPDIRLRHIRPLSGHMQGRLIVACLVDTLTQGGEKWQTSLMTAPFPQVGQVGEQAKIPYQLLACSLQRPANERRQTVTYRTYKQYRYPTIYRDSTVSFKRPGYSSRARIRVSTDT